MTSPKDSNKIYCIPGLGVDSRIFQDLDLNANLHFLEWIEPKLGESLKSYAARLVASIPIEESSIWLGLSFGGIIAQELTRILNVEKLILISTMKDTSEKPLLFRLFRYIPLYQLSRGNWRIKSLPYWAPRFGITQSEDIRLLQDMFRKSSDSCRMWAMEKLANWEGTPPDLPCLHIHGDQDKVFPIRRIKNAVKIEGGNHYMVRQRAHEINRIINDWLEEVIEEKRG